jgi:hypothetical protein
MNSKNCYFLMLLYFVLLLKEINNDKTVQNKTEFQLLKKLPLGTNGK